jgi:hypothetical protein
MHVRVPVVAGLLFSSGASPALAEWGDLAKVIASDGGASDSFGYSVAICENIAVIGARADDDAGADSGSAYVFHFDGTSWSEQQKLLASDGAESDLFGRTLSVSGEVVAVGAYQDDDNGSQSGSAYVFHFDGSGWVEQAKLLASDGADIDQFGYSVAASGAVVVVGAWWDDDPFTDTGSAYVFRFDGSSWIEEAKLLAPDGYWWDTLGYAVAISGEVAIVGAIEEDDNVHNAGAAYLFGFDSSSAPGCNGNRIADDVDIAEGTSEDCNANGVPDECDIAAGDSDDLNANGVPDECEHLVDVITDLLLNALGASRPSSAGAQLASPP